MKTFSRYIPILSLLLFVLSSCGYHNPYVYKGPEKVIYITEWKNRTSELNLDSDIYQSLLRWYQKSGSISISKEKAGADFILAGEIVSIDLPSLSYGSGNTATQVKIRLRVRYILQDARSEKFMIEQPGETWTQDYLIASDVAQTRSNQEEALDTIIEDLSQKIYQKTLVELPKLTN